MRKVCKGGEIHTFFTRNSSIRDLYATFYLITIRIDLQKVIVLITIENKRKTKKVSVLRLDLSFLLKMCVDL